MRFCIKFIPLLMLPLLCACAREEWPAGEMIRFSVDGVSAELLTKEEEKPKPASPVIDKIRVWADKKQGNESSWTQVFADQPQVVQREMDSENVLWNYWGSGGVPIKWIPNSPYRFRSVYPVDDATLQPSSSSEELVVDYSMHEDNYDLMVAAKSFLAKPADNLVPLTFHHATAAVCFRFQTKTSDTYLTNFELQHVYTLGTLKYKGADGVSPGEWNLYGLRAQQVYPWSGTAKGLLHFRLNLTNRELTVTQGTSAQSSNPDATVWLEYGDDVKMGLYKTSSDTDPDEIYEITADFDSSRGFHLLVGARIWGGDGTLLALDTPYTIVKNAEDIYFAYIDDTSTSYWAVSDEGPTVFRDEWFYAIPQNLNVNDDQQPAVSFTYTVGQISISETLPLPVTGPGGDITWEAGKVYLYNVRIQPESTITVSVADWDAFYVSTDDLIF